MLRLSNVATGVVDVFVHDTSIDRVANVLRNLLPD